MDVLYNVGVYMVSISIKDHDNLSAPHQHSDRERDTLCNGHSSS